MAADTTERSSPRDHAGIGFSHWQIALSATLKSMDGQPNGDMAHLMTWYAHENLIANSQS